ncbi:MULTISPECIES: site-specific DNA-methyltransferase [Planktothrix]|uniref:site-specific DNA-methyltransferase n=1 Tax=Planktothrix TaxID=54304 RepID=UPI0004281CDD|nr:MULTISPECIES: site-specific DNA-methyltransferase [Planktothrix]CAH2571006.1 Type III restriction-modification system StyLTI enzyme mod [Planktothrix rubescens]
MTKKQRLELTWIGKDIRPKLEPRILLEDPEKSYHATHRMSENDIFDNRLIFGDNLLALKALESEFAGKVKCVFIDPPYNTGSAFEHYDDGVEHSIWLGLMRDRLEILRNLLSNDGSIWITIDDNEAHYLKVMCDEIFGRINFVANVIWQKKYAPANDSLWLSDSHDHILVFSKNKSIWRPNKLARTTKQDQLYSNPDNDPRGSWMSDNYTCAKSADERPNLYYAIHNPNTNEEIWPKKTRVWAFEQSTHQRHIEENKIYWGKDGKNSTPRLKKFLSDLHSQGRVPSTIWFYEEVGHTQDARREVLALNPKNPFSTPKPEKLIQQILQIATNSGDLVLDSFAGSGTTGAVAHKMGRRWIMIELGEHCHTHIIPRLKKVIDGEDQGGISKAFNWKGGGGFRYYQLAPSLLEKDKWDNWIINKTYNAEMLAEALCKIEGFTYSPSDTFYWQHGYSTERDFIYVTTQNLRHEQLSQLADEVGQERSLLVLCTAFRGKTDIFPNLTVKKIPKQILSRCEWGHDDYSLKIENLPKAPKKIGQLTLFDLDNIQ